MTLTRILTALLFCLSLISCQDQNKVKFTIHSTKPASGLQSISGMAKLHQHYFAVGDDSPYLFKLNDSLEITSKTEIFSLNQMSDGRIKKSIKPDFEAVEIIDEDILLIFGSGSKSPQRDICLLIHLKDSITIERYDLGDFYAHLRSQEVMNGFELNIEALAYQRGQLFLLNRGRNIMFEFNYDKFVRYLRSNGPTPTLSSTLFSLPRIQKNEAGFSGATCLSQQNKIIFTASVENTDNAYDDGEILGSFVGVLDLDIEEKSSNLKTVRIQDQNSKLKVETVLIEQENSTGADLLLATDSDGLASHFLKGRLEW